MNNLVHDISQFLVDNGLGALGTDIFIGDIPATSENAIMVMPSNSEAPDLYLDTQYLSVDVWVRNSDTAAAYEKLDTVFALFHRKANYTLGASNEVYFSHATGNVEDMGRDAENRKLLKLALRFIYHSLNNIS